MPDTGNFFFLETYRLNANALHTVDRSNYVIVAIVTDILKFVESVLSNMILMCCCAVALDSWRLETLAVLDCLHL